MFSLNPNGVVTFAVDSNENMAGVPTYTETANTHTISYVETSEDGSLIDKNISIFSEEGWEQYNENGK
jgi:hypothetical protein